MAALHGSVHRAGGDAGLQYLLTSSRIAEVPCAAVRGPWQPGETIDVCAGMDPRSWQDA
jgi:hypothetical protein